MREEVITTHQVPFDGKVRDMETGVDAGVGAQGSRRGGIGWALKLIGAAAVVGALAAPKLDLERWVSVLAPSHDSASARTDSVQRTRSLRVDALVVGPEPLAEVVRTTGTLLAAEAVELRPEASGRIVSIHFEEGRTVEAGDLLVKLYDADLRARLRAATGELDLARRRERRAAELVEQRFLRQDEHDAALARVQILEAEIALIEAQIAKTEIRAPFTGTVGLRHVSEGAVVDASTRIATVQRTDILKIDFAVPERYARRVKVGSPIVFGVAGSEARYAGRVYAVDPHIDAATRTLAIRAVTENSSGELIPGAFASIDLLLEETADALMIPSIALVPELESPYVFVLVDGRVEQRRIVTGVRTESRVQVLSGLRPGDIVITTGLQQLRAGDRVDVRIVGDTSTTEGASISASAREPSRVVAPELAALSVPRR